MDSITSLFRCLEKYNVNDQRPSLKYHKFKKDHFLFSTITQWKLLQPYSNLHMNCIFSVLYVSKSTTCRPPAKNDNPGRKYHFQPLSPWKKFQSYSKFILELYLIASCLLSLSCSKWIPIRFENKCFGFWFPASHHLEL